MIRVENLTVSSGEFTLSDVCFEIPTGAYGVLMGKTGSGKTTLLETIAGLKPTRSGSIVLHGNDVTRLLPSQRNIGYVPQDGALFTTMTVRDQIGFALSIRGESKTCIDERVAELAEALEISDLLPRKPLGLSGGERQRVALGRALAFNPQTLCLDEPLSALDQETRDQTIELLQKIQRQSGVTCLHVTHNAEEAQRLADVTFRIIDGKIQQD